MVPVELACAKERRSDEKEGDEDCTSDIFKQKKGSNGARASLQAPLDCVFQTRPNYERWKGAR